MRMTFLLSLAALTVGGAIALAADEPLIPEVGQSVAAHEPAVTTRAPASPPPAATALGDKAYAEPRNKGVAWLLSQQRSDGGWGAGAWGQDNRSAPSDVATTVVAAQALIRDARGSSTHAEPVKRAITHVVAAIEEAPEGPRLRTPEGTQPQHKLGPLVDTHLAALFLGEVLPGIDDVELKRRANIAYDQVLTKVQQAQQANGSFETGGWAPVLSNSFAVQSLVDAQAAGKEVDRQVMERAEEGLMGSGGMAAGAGSAGVDLYAVASTARSSAKMKSVAADSDAMKRSMEQANLRVATDSDGRLMQGFGSMGGEEMLAYMQISDTLAEEEPEQYEDWSARIGDHLTSIQNGDGSWSGHHCITSTTFVTAAALMTLGAGDHAALSPG